VRKNHNKIFLPWLTWICAKGWSRYRPFLASIRRPREVVLAIGLTLSHAVAVTVWFLAMLVLPVGGYLLFAALSVYAAVWLPYLPLTDNMYTWIGPGFGWVLTIISMLRITLRRSLILNQESSEGVELNGLDELLGGSSTKVLAQADFDKILVSVGPDAHTEVRGGRRVVVLGAPIIELLEPQELRAVVAHEEAHHEHMGMTLVEIVWRGATSSQLLVDLSSRPTTMTCEFEIGSNDHYEIINLLENMFVKFATVAKLIMKPSARLTSAAARELSHRLEFACDRAAAGQVGADTLLSALRKITVISVAWEFYLGIWCQPSEGRADLASFVEFLNSGVLLELEPFITSAWREESDRHPSGPRRAEALGVADTGFDLGCEWRLDNASALANPELRRVIESQIVASAFQAQWSHWALELIHARLSEDERHELADNQDMIPAVIILARYLPAAEIFVRTSGLDRVSDTVLRGLEQMAMQQLIDTKVVETRRNQLLKSTNGFPDRSRLALELLVNLASVLPPHQQVRLVGLRGHHYICRRERLSESIARWQKHREDRHEAAVVRPVLGLLPVDPLPIAE
jgi:Zn-dependent protease with chaperone function